MIKAIVFDLDGTLLNTLEDLRNSVNSGLFQLGLPPITLEETRVFIGNGTWKLTERALKENFTEERHELEYKLFKEHYDHHYLDSTIAYPGVQELLEKLHNDGYLLAVVSNKNDDKVQALINKIFPGLFDAIQGTYVGKPTKPDPYVSNLVFEKLGITGKEALMIGDTEVDMQTAINAGMDYILVNYGYRTNDELKEKCSGSLIVSNCKELYKQIKSRKSN